MSRRAIALRNTRGVYLWAGSATIELQRAKFPDIPIDEEAHLHAHTIGAARELATCGINLAFLSMNWGFPPEVEVQHWREFQDAVGAYAEAGIAVIGYVQASNCLCAGSYAGRDWFAQDPQGRRIPYFRNRLMTCWNDPDWIAEVREHACRAARAGAIGVFFDNLWMGATPWTLGGPVSGFAGCACGRCQHSFAQCSGRALPARLGEDDATREYLRWRALVVFNRLADWRFAVLQENPDAVILANNCDVILRDTAGLFGLDPALLAELQDALLLENVAMPEFTGKRLVANAIPLKALQALAPDKAVLSVAYERGIGLDRAPAVRRVRRFIAEVVAVGASPVIKGSEYLDARGWFSVITASSFADVRQATGQLLRWCTANSVLYDDCRPDPAVVVPLDASGHGPDWSASRPATLLTALALLRAQVPFVFAPASDAMASGLPVIAADESWTTRSRLDGASVRRILDAPMRAFSRAYFGNARVRRWIDASGITGRFLQSPYFALPADWPRIRDALPQVAPPTASAEQPILVERWRHPSGAVLLHLVNYADVAARVTLRLPRDWSARLHTPDASTRWASTQGDLVLDCYAVIECRPD